MNGNFVRKTIAGSVMMSTGVLGLGVMHHATNEMSKQDPQVEAAIDESSDIRNKLNQEDVSTPHREELKAQLDDLNNIVNEHRNHRDNMELVALTAFIGSAGAIALGGTMIGFANSDRFIDSLSTLNRQ